VEAHELLGDAVLEIDATWDKLKREEDKAVAYTAVSMQKMAEKTVIFQNELNKLGTALRQFTAGSAEFSTLNTRTAALVEAYKRLNVQTRDYERQGRAVIANTKEMSRQFEIASKRIDLTSEQMSLLVEQTRIASVVTEDYTTRIEIQVRGIEGLNRVIGEYISLMREARSVEGAGEQRAFGLDPRVQALMGGYDPVRGRRTAWQPLMPEEATPASMLVLIAGNINAMRSLESTIKDAATLPAPASQRGRYERRQLEAAPEDIIEGFATTIKREMVPVQRAMQESSSAVKQFVAQAMGEAPPPAGGVSEAQLLQELVKQGGDVGQRAEVFQRRAMMDLGNQFQEQGQISARLQREIKAAQENLAEEVASGDSELIGYARKQFDELQGVAKALRAPAFRGAKGGPNIGPDNSLPVAIVAPGQSGLGPRAAILPTGAAPIQQVAPSGVKTEMPISSTAPPAQPIEREPTAREIRAAYAQEMGGIAGRLEPQGRVQGFISRVGQTPTQYFTQMYERIGMRPPTFQGPEAGQAVTQYIGAIMGAIERGEITAPPTRAQLRPERYAHFERMMGTQGTGEEGPADYDPFTGRIYLGSKEQPQVVVPRVPAQLSADEVRRINQIAQVLGPVRRQMEDEITASVAGALGAAPTAGPAAMRAPMTDAQRRAMWAMTMGAGLPSDPRAGLVPGGPTFRGTQAETMRLLYEQAGGFVPWAPLGAPRQLGMGRGPDPFGRLAPGEGGRIFVLGEGGRPPALPGLPPYDIGQMSASQFERYLALLRGEGRMGGARAALPPGPSPYAMPEAFYPPDIGRQQRARAGFATLLTNAAILDMFAGAAGGGRGGGGVPPVALGGGGDGGGGGFWGGLFGMGGGEAARRALWGQGFRIPLPFLGGIAGAGFGTLGALGGLGPEHFLLTGLGLAGSAMGALAGGATLAAGAAGTMAVGGGADVAVLKSTITDTQSLYQGLQQLNTAVATYGKNSAQAALATSQLHIQMQQLGGTARGQAIAVGVQAEMQLAKQVDALNTLWDKATQNARVQAVSILEQVVKLGHDYVPRVALAAQENLKIIDTGLRPLFSWLEGPQGVQIFNDLENQFRKNLPQAVHAFTQLIEVLLRFVDAASTHTGGFIGMLDRLFTRLNDRSPQYFATVVDKLVGDFKTWEYFLKLVGEDLYYLFRQNAGAGKDIILTLDGMLLKLRDWELSTRGQAQLRNIFTVHKDEIVTLVSVLGQLASTAGKFYLAVSPLLTGAMTGIIALFGEFAKIVTSLGPQVTFLVSSMLLMQKWGLLLPLLTNLKKAFVGVAEGEAAMAVATDVAGAGPKGSKGFGPAAIGNLFSGLMGPRGAARAEQALGETALAREATIAAEGGALAGLPFLGVGGRGAGLLRFLGPAGIGRPGGPLGGPAIGEQLALDLVDRPSAGMLARLRAGLAGRGSIVQMFERLGLRPGAATAAGIGAAGAAGYFGGAAIQSATGLRQQGTQSAIGGLVGTLAGAATMLIPGVGPIGGMIASGILGGVGTALGPTIVHLFDHIFGLGAGVDYGTKFMKGFTDATGGAQFGLMHAALTAVGPRQLEQQKAQIKTTLDQARHYYDQYTQDQQTRGRFPGGIYGLGTQTEQDRQKMLANFAKAGRESAQTFVEAMSAPGVHPTEFAFEQDAANVLKGLPPMARGAAMQTMIALARSLEEHGKLPKTALGRLILDMENQFPALRSYLASVGESTASEVASQMKMRDAHQNLATSMQQFQQEWALYNVNPVVTGKNWASNIQTEMNDIKTIMLTTTGSTHQHAKQEYKQLQTELAGYFAAMGQTVATKMTFIKAQIVSGSTTAVSQAQTQFNNFANQVNKVFTGSAKATAEGTRLILKAANETLKALGAKQIPNVGLTAAEITSLMNYNFTGGTTVTTHGHFAGGGLIQVGEPGARGLDNIMMNAGGMPIMVGAGEQVAVFNAHQQQVMDQRLSDYGGLGGFFDTVNMPHSRYAGGGMVSGYSLPLPRNEMYVGRWSIDQGVDIPAGAGTPELAIGPGKIVGAGIQGFGPNAPILRISAGPLQGMEIYYGHAGPNRVGVGANVVAGQQISEVGAGIVGMSTGPHIEIGFYPPGPMGSGARMATVLNELLQGAKVAPIIAAGGAPGSGQLTIPTIQVPKVVGTGVAADIVRGALQKDTAAANAWVQKYAGAAAGATGMVGTAGVHPGTWFQVARQIAKRHGWSEAEVQAWYKVEQMEDGSLSLTAKNPTSPAYGLAQFISGPSEYYQYKGDPNTIVGQLTAMANYIAGRYTTPSGALAFHMTHPYYARGGFVQGFQGGGVSHRGRSPYHNPTGSHHAGATNPRHTGHGGRPAPAKHYHPPRAPSLPHLKGFRIVGQMPVSVSEPLDDIAELDIQIADLQNVLGLLQAREALYPVGSIVTDQYGVQHVNWGGVPNQMVRFPPGGIGEQVYGMLDPTSNLWQYGLDVRLGEIGPVGGLGGTTTDQSTELGIYNKMLADYYQELGYVHQAMGPAIKWSKGLISRIGHYDRFGNFKPGVLAERITRLKLAEKWLAPTKSDEEIHLQEKYRKVKNELETKYAKARLDARLMRVALIQASSSRQAFADARLTPHPPPAFLRAAGPGGAQAAAYEWSAQRALEVAGVTQRFNYERQVIEDQSLNKEFKQTVDYKKRLLLLANLESHERQKMNDFFAARRIELQTLVGTLQQRLQNDRTALDAAIGTRAPGTGQLQGGVIGQLKAYTDPHGAFQTQNIGLLKTVTIPGLIKEIGDIGKTTPSQPTALALQDAQLLASLQTQQLQIQAETLAAQQSGFAVLTQAINSLPPFGGSFQTGGIVPGPLGEARTIIAHGGETITPSQPQMRMLIRLEDNRTRIFVDDVEQQVHVTTTTAARHARRQLPGAGGGLLT
jgi:murein DD-endopeptidase MepM/ murein hydrolase activator NlpD